MAIGWVRTVFHDFGTYDAAKGTGGLDASILTTSEALFPDNGAVYKGGNIPFFRRQSILYPSVSAADWIALGGLVALRQCGGPDLTLRFRPGRKSVYVPNDPTLLPGQYQTASELNAIFARMNLTTSQYVTLVIGAHSLGGANMTVGSAGFGVYPGIAFDGTPTVFDNAIWKRSLSYPLILQSDREIMTQPGANTTASLFAGNQSAFFEQYAEVFMTMLDIGHTELGCPLSGDGCTTAQMADSPIANQLTTIPDTWIEAKTTTSGLPLGPVVTAVATNNNFGANGVSNGVIVNSKAGSCGSEKYHVMCYNRVSQLHNKFRAHSQFKMRPLSLMHRLGFGLCFVATLLSLAALPVLAFNYTLIRQELSDNGRLHNSMGGCGNMAIGWVRTVFHDFATYNVTDGSGGIDSSVLTTVEANLPDNGAILGGGNVAFFREQALLYPSVTASDWIVIGAIAGIHACGGPDFRGRFRPGRIDSFTPNDYSLLPDFRMSLAQLQGLFRRMNLTQTEYFTLVIGSHSLGGANMTIGSIGFGQDGSNGKPFDSTPTTFDNDIFKRATANPLILDSDRQLMNDTNAMNLAQLYSGNMTEFFTAYENAFFKMVDMGHQNLGCRLDGNDCTEAQMLDIAIPNQLTTIPSSWLSKKLVSSDTPAVVNISFTNSTNASAKTLVASSRTNSIPKFLVSVIVICLPLGVMGQEYNYDDTGIMFSYFLLSVLALALIPSTYFWAFSLLGPHTIGPANADCDCKACIIQRNRLTSKEKKEKSARIPYKEILLATGWVLAAFLLYRVATAKFEEEIWNPWELMGIDEGVSDTQIKKMFRKLSLLYHPDKLAGKNLPPAEVEAITSKYVEIGKAYKVLTDADARQRWEEFGHPDGKQCDLGSFVLLVYALIFGVGLPVVVARWWYSSKNLTKDGILHRTMGKYYQELKESTNKRELLDLLSISDEYKNVKLDLASPAATKLLNAVKVKLTETSGETFGRTNSYANKCPWSVPVLLLLYAHILRVPIEDPAILEEQQKIVSISIQLTGGLTQIAVTRRWLPVIQLIIEINQCLVQAVYLNQPPNAQLPGLSPSILSHFQKGKRSVKTIKQFLDLAEEEQKLLLKTLDESEQAEVLKVAKRYPVARIVKTKFYVKGDSKITPGSMVTLSITIGIQDVTDIQESKTTVADPENNGKDDEDEDEKFEWWNPKPKSTVFAHAPYFPELKTPIWWVLLGEKKGNRLVHIGNAKNLVTEKSVKLEFQAPPNQGIVDLLVVIKPDSYIGCDMVENVRFVVEAAPQIVEIDDDISDPEEDSIAGQMQALRKGGNPAAVKSEGDVDTDSDDSDDD
ncbi:secretory subunit [Nowakowskiella sp. JEL0078]|nr:secretory subunit [Nowakowskiella sp. JEL0078]